jgi:hypothetical protein
MTNRNRNADEPTAIFTIMEVPPAVPFGRRFQKFFNVGKTKQNELIRNGEIDSVLIANEGGRGRRQILTGSYLAYLRRQQQKEAAGEIGRPSPNPRARQRAAGDAPAPQLRPLAIENATSAKHPARLSLTSAKQSIHSRADARKTPARRGQKDGGPATVER